MLHCTRQLIAIDVHGYARSGPFSRSFWQHNYSPIVINRRSYFDSAAAIENIWHLNSIIVKKKHFI